MTASRRWPYLTTLLVASGAVAAGLVIPALMIQDLGWLLLGVAVAVVGSLLAVASLQFAAAEAGEAPPVVPLPMRAIYLGGVATGGLLVIRPGNALTISDLLFIVGFILTSAYLLDGAKTIRGVSPWVVVGVLSFAFGGLASSFASERPLDSMGLLARFVFVALGWIWLGVQVMDRWGTIRLVAVAWSLTGALAGVGAIAQATLGDVIPGTAISWGRMTGFTQHVNDLGGVCAIAVPLAAGLLVGALRDRHRSALPLGGLLALNLVGVALSGSVGGSLAALIGLGVVAVMTRWTPALLTAATAAVLAMTAAGWVPH